MIRDRILREIRRIAASSGGAPPGRDVFERLTGIRQSEWYPNIWVRWGDAIAAAGLAPNALQARIPDDVVVLKYVELAHELGRLPVAGELRQKAQKDKDFPSHTVFSRFGGKRGLLEAVAEYCREHEGCEAVAELVSQYQSKRDPAGPADVNRRVITGFVYLMKSGRHHKIGRTNSVARRGGELSVQVPVPPKTIHSIETDDPVGVEAYWHKRFADRRGQGEWFELSAEDVRAFKRWKRIA